MQIQLKTEIKTNDDLIDKSKTVLWRSMLKMQELAIRNAPVDTGRLRSSIRLSPFADGETKYTLSDGVEYGIHVEFGTSPHYLPVNPLKGWSRRVLGNENAAYAVMHKIAREGTPAQPFFRPAFDEVRRIWAPRLWNQVLSSQPQTLKTVQNK